MYFGSLLTIVEGLGKKANRKAAYRTAYSEVSRNESGRPAVEGEDKIYHEKAVANRNRERRLYHACSRSDDTSEEIPMWKIFRLGLFAGMFTVLFTVMIIAAIKADKDIQWEPAFCMFRGLFLFILEFFLFGINLYAWKSVGIDHAHICELDPQRKHLSALEVLEFATFFAVVWGVSVVCFIFSGQFGVSPYFHPLALTSFFLLFFVNTLDIFHRHARFWLLRSLWGVLKAPFHHVGFADFWLADQLNSLVVALLDMEFLACYYGLDFYSVQDRSQCGSKLYGLRPLIACLPAWWRFAQSLRRYKDTKQRFPHIANAGKYGTTFFVVFFSTVAASNRESKGYHQTDFYFTFWIFSAMVSTCYTFTWDIKMDWGLMAKNDRGNTFLRAKLLYKHKSFYYFAMVSDLFLRFSWILTVSVGEAGLFHSEVLTGLLAVLEVFRRFIWNFLRVENEHISRSGGTTCHSREELREYDEDEENTND